MGMGIQSSDSAGAGGEVREPVPQLRAAPQAIDQDFKTPAKPSMSEMLKDIGSVKLRTIDAVR